MSSEGTPFTDTGMTDELLIGLNLRPFDMYYGGGFFDLQRSVDQFIRESLLSLSLSCLLSRAFRLCVRAWCSCGCGRARRPLSRRAASTDTTFCLSVTTAAGAAVPEVELDLGPMPTPKHRDDFFAGKHPHSRSRRSSASAPRSILTLCARLQPTRAPFWASSWSWPSCGPASS